eukprot:3953030-Pyramimonas_sp.AAC.2
MTTTRPRGQGRFLLGFTPWNMRSSPLFLASAGMRAAALVLGSLTAASLAGREYNSDGVVPTALLTTRGRGPRAATMPWSSKCAGRRHGVNIPTLPASDWSAARI